MPGPWPALLLALLLFLALPIPPFPARLAQPPGASAVPQGHAGGSGGPAPLQQGEPPPPPGGRGRPGLRPPLRPRPFTSP